MGSSHGATAWETSVSIGVAGGGTGRGTDSTVVGTKWLRVSRAAVSGSGFVTLFRLGVMDGVDAEDVSGYGVGAAHGSRVTSYSCGSGGGTGGAFLGGMPDWLHC